MKSLVNTEDIYGMNWIEGNKDWGTVKKPNDIDVSTERLKEGDIIRERYIFTNNGDKDIFTSLKDIAIYTTFNDNYEDAAVCMTNRCHAHIWCGENVSYVRAVRMNGEPPHLGLALIKGSLSGYSVERDLEKMSNDRGDFLLHPTPFHLAPKESYTIEWVLFYYKDISDFYKKIKYYTNYIKVKANNYTLFEGETVRIECTPFFACHTENIHIFCNDEEMNFEIKNKKIIVEDIKESLGEYVYDVFIEGIHTVCRIVVVPKLNILLEKRCKFIAAHQQYHGNNSHLNGAYLIYDNAEKHCYYSHTNDYNAGRERVGMGILMATYIRYYKENATDDHRIAKRYDRILEKYKNKIYNTRNDDLLKKIARYGKKDLNIDDCEESLKLYVEFVRRELFDQKTGEVFNDVGRDNDYERLYNYPWMSLFFIELYKLYNEKQYLEDAVKILIYFYKAGGAHFYAIQVPVFEIITLLKSVNMESSAEIMLNYFREHARYIMDRGYDYPSHEVSYEQSIVAPAADILLQIYKITNESVYLEGAKRQIKVLKLFNGLQPDYHLYENAIRHWDGYWFGKRKLYGDTFPHYWSALTGNVYREYGEITGDAKYLKKADNSFRGVLSLFKPDGSASCAMVYPVMVNGAAANYYDDFANDQDWGLYFACRNF